MAHRDLLAVDWRDLVEHRGWVAADATLGNVQEMFSADGPGFLAVLEGESPIGLCSRDHVGTKLGSRYGFPIFAKAPVREHLLPSALFVREDEPLADVLPRVFARKEESFGEDVILIDAQGRFLGLIGVQALVNLQTRLLLRSIEELEAKQADIDRRHRQMVDELHVARELQLALLPREARTLAPGTPRGASARVLSRYVPLDEVGGDFFEIVPVSPGALGVLIFDVSGHGVRAALLTALLRGLVHANEGALLRPGEVLARVNESFHAILEAGRIGSFASAFALVVDLDARLLRFSSAGHPSPLLLRRGASLPVPLDDDPDSNQGVLGILPGTVFPTREVGIADGDAVLLFTDGLFEVEGPGGELLGERGLERLVSGLSGERGEPLLDGLLREVRSFATAGALRDDLCLLAVEVSDAR